MSRSGLEAVRSEVRSLAAAAVVLAVLTAGGCAGSGDSDRPEVAQATSTTVPAGRSRLAPTGP